MLLRNKINWIDTNSFKKNEGYIHKLLKFYKFEENKDYKLIYNGYGDYDLLITWNRKTYKIQIDEESQCYNLLARNEANNIKRKERYHFLESFHGDDLILKIIKHIKSREV